LLLSVCLFFSCLSVVSVALFFLLMRRPPPSTLFPTRRSSDLVGGSGFRIVVGGDLAGGMHHLVTAEHRDEIAAGLAPLLQQRVRSEEHTSELQSRENLVCRLLLEKKKENTQNSGPVLRGTPAG